MALLPDPAWSLRGGHPHLFFVDTETTGKIFPRVTDLAVVDAAAAAAPPGVPPAPHLCFSTLVDPGRRIEPGAELVTHITSGMVRGVAPGFPAAWRAALAFIDARVQVSH